MNKKNAANTMAVIEISTDSVRMQVSQLSKGNVSTLDRLEYPLALDHDVFETGSISFESLRKLSGALDRFSSALLSYNITEPYAVSSPAMNEAGNRSLVLDQLRVRNGLEITALENGQEKAYLYAEILTRLDQAGLLKEGPSVIAFVGSGSIGVAVFDGQKIVYFQNISMGALKLYDVLRGLRSTSEDVHTVVEEYLDTVLSRVAMSEFPIQNLILTGSNIRLVAKLCGAKETDGIFQIDTASIADLYASLRSVTAENIGLRYGITEGEAAVLYTALAIYRSLLRFCPKAKTAYSPAVSITEAIARCGLSAKAAEAHAELCRKSAVACAENTARHFRCDLRHAQSIRELSCRIFDKLKRVHGLDPSKRLILELAALLHSCGSFVSIRQHNRCTFDLIRGMDLFGLSEAETLETAFVAGSGSENLAEEGNPDFDRLHVQEKLTVSKLSAIFQLANALDKSHKDKLKNLKISVEGDRVIFKASASGDTLLERWAFDEAAQFFKTVFGMSPELSVKFSM